MKRIIFRQLILFLLPLIAIGSVQASPLEAKKSPEQEKEQLELITRMTAAILTRNHYRQHPLDNEFSIKIFNEYFRLLDPNDIFFTQDDIKSFGKYKLYLDDLTVAGDYSFAFKVYDLYIKRFEQYRKFAEASMKKGFNFSKDEYIEIDRSKSKKRPVNKTELHEAWRKKIKNDVLYFRLMDRAMKEDKNNDKDKKKVHASWSRQTAEEKIQHRLHDIANEIEKRDKLGILGLYLTAVAQVYGPHSNYMTPKQEQDFNIDMKLSLSGIGALLGIEDGFTKVVKLIPGGPAEKGGELKGEDRIIAVAQDGGEPVNIIDMPISKVVNLIRGKKGTKVILTVLPGDKGINAVPKQIAIVRDVVKLKDSEAKGEIKEITGPDGSKKKLGIISLSRFYIDFKAAHAGDPNYKSSTRDVAKILENFNKKKVDGVIMDMRSNGGGSLMEAISLSGLFIRSGPVVQVRGANENVSVKEDPDPAIQYSGPLMVLTNKLTSSAAEIFTGAIKDYNRGIIVGDSRTYGKGTVLDVYELNDLLRYMGKKFPGGTLKFETALFFRVNGSSTQKIGIKPHIFIDSVTEAMEVGEEHNRHSVPWARISSVEHEDFDSKLPDKIKTLLDASRKRCAGNPKFKIRERDLKTFRDYKKRKVVSLNEEKRWLEYKKQKKVQEEQSKLLEDDAEKDDKNEDLFMDEAVQIMRDYMFMPQSKVVDHKKIAKN